MNPISSDSLALEARIRGGGLNRNRSLDFTAPTAFDLSDYQYRAVRLDPTGVAPYAGYGGTFSGILQNKGDEGRAVVRFAGISRVVITDAVTAGDFVHIGPGAGTDATKYTPGTDGHKHYPDAGDTEHVIVRVTNVVKGTGVTGLTASDLSVVQYYSEGGVVGVQSYGSTYVEEDVNGNGYYLVGTLDSSNVGFAHMLTIDLVGHPDYTVNPSLHTWMARPSFHTVPDPDTWSQILGTALESGVADDPILIELMPQRF